MKTILLENDEWFRKGEEDFYKSFDPEYIRINTDPTNNHMLSDDFYMVGMLSQPFVGRIIASSGFEQIMGIDPITWEKNWQLAHYMNLVEGALKVRNKLKYMPLHVEINYHGIDFVRDVNANTWGINFRKGLERVVRQNVDNLIINVYDDFVFKYRIVEGMIDCNW